MKGGVISTCGAAEVSLKTETQTTVVHFSSRFLRLRCVVGAQPTDDSLTAAPPVVWQEDISSHGCECPPPPCPFVPDWNAYI